MKNSYLLLSILILWLISSCTKSGESSTSVLKDIYTVGYEFNGANYVAKNWKNSVVTNLTDGTKDNYGQSIAVAGTDLYVAGYEDTSTKGEAKYWKNGGATNIVTDASLSAVSYSIFVN